MGPVPLTTALLLAACAQDPHTGVATARGAADAPPAATPPSEDTPSPVPVPTPPRDAATAGGDLARLDAATSGARPDAAAVHADATRNGSVDALGGTLGAVLYTDRFQAGDFSDWTVARGQWQICAFGDARALCPVGTAMSALLVGDPSWTDYEVEAKVVVSSDAERSFMYIGFRAQTPAKFYAFGMGRPYTGGSQWEMGQASATGMSHNNGGPFFYHFDEPFLFRVRVQGKVATIFQQEWKDYGKKTDFNIKPIAIMRGDLPPSGRVAIGATGMFGVKVLSMKVTQLDP